MQSEFYTYLELGFSHISDLQGYDHMLFLVALCAVYRLAEWRQVAILVTAFTIGHSLTLALAAVDWIDISSQWIEFLIPLTIFLTAAYHVFRYSRRDISQDDNGDEVNRASTWTGTGVDIGNYVLAALFGLIHGLGFSNFFGAMLLPGEESHLIRQLLAFNIGVELGQLAIVLVILLISYVSLNVLRIPQRYWVWVVSLSAGVPALWMMIDRWPI